MRARSISSFNAAASEKSTKCAVETSGSNMDVVRRVCAPFGSPAPPRPPSEEHIRFVGDRPGHDLRYGIDSTKLERKLGWLALEDLDSGIGKTVRWYVDNEW
jgi:dTDP-glucose 4,6-dehydratase